MQTASGVPCKKVRILIAGLLASGLCQFGHAHAAEDENNSNADGSGIEVSGSWLVIGQRANRAGLTPGERSSRFSTRLDLEIEKPLESINGKAFAHIRSGMGSGIQLGRPTFTGAVNSTAFAKDGDHLHDAKAILAQAWVEFGLPLPFSAKGANSPALSLIVGKIDPTVFFDHNELAHDESEKFINNLLVHNPLLDSGGEYGFDENGFSPGLLLHYETRREDRPNWMANVGFFGAGNGTTLDNRPSNPFTMVQLRYFGKIFMNLPGSISAYYWNNPKIPNALDGSLEAHTGNGASIDQNLTQDFSVFARISHGIEGVRSFDRAISYGAQLKGGLWSRPQDHIALGVARLRPDPLVVAAGAPSFKESTAELMYQYAWNEQLHVSADLQWIRNSAGDPTAPTIRLVGLRTKLSF